jgi:hypothetical protein
MFFIKRRSLLPLLSGVLAILIVGCFGNGDPQPTTTAVVSIPTMVATPVVASPNADVSIPSTKVIPSPTVKSDVVVPTPTSIPTVETMPIAELSQGRCLLNSGSGTFGTAPGPTPTPTSSGADSESIGPTVSEHLKAFALHLKYWSNLFETEWAVADSPEREAAALFKLNQRASSLCKSVRTVESALSADGLLAQYKEALRIRHSWSNLAIEQLLCCGSGRTADLEKGRDSTAKYVASTTEFVLQTLIDVGSLPSLQVLEGVGVIYQPEAGWLISDSAGSALLIAPIDLQKDTVDGLGPLKVGTGIRIRRFALADQQTLDEAVLRFGHLPKSIGEIRDHRASVIFGIDVETWVSESDLGWVTELSIGVDEKHVYIVEVGCPPTLVDKCSSVSHFLDSMVLLGS